MARQIQYWSVESDTIDETVPPSAETKIFAHVDRRNGELPEDTVARAKLACYDYRDPDGYYCQRGIPHPLNDERVARGLRPLFLSSYTIDEDDANITVCAVSLNWRVPEQMDGAVDLRQVPPVRSSWSEPTPSFRNPDTGEWHLTTAGELIHGITVETYWDQLTYTLREPQLPNWYRKYFGSGKGGVINSDMVVLDGQAYKPRTLWIPEVPANPIEVGLSWWRELTVTVRIREDTWDIPVPNAGLFERIYFLVDAGVRSSGNRYRADKYLSGNNLALAIAMADKKLVYQTNAVPNSTTNRYRVVSSYRRIQDQYEDSIDDDVEHSPTNVVEPAALAPWGSAYRNLENSPYSLREIQPRELVTLRLGTLPAVRFSEIGLW